MGELGCLAGLLLPLTIGGVFCVTGVSAIVVKGMANGDSGGGGVLGVAGVEDVTGVTELFVGVVGGDLSLLSKDFSDLVGVTGCSSI